MPTEDPAAIAVALDGYAKQKLILSWRHVEGRGWAVVIGADMAERVLRTPRDAEVFCWGLASAACAVHDGEALP